MSIQIFDKYQKLLFSDYADKGHVSEGAKKVEYTKRLRLTSISSGLGKRPARWTAEENLTRCGTAINLVTVWWKTLYKSIPFFMSNYRYGIFLDNTYKSEFKIRTESLIITASRR